MVVYSEMSCLGVHVRVALEIRTLVTFIGASHEHEYRIRSSLFLELAVIWKENARKQAVGCLSLPA